MSRSSDHASTGTPATAPAARAQAAAWTIDPAHTLAEFKVRHMMVSNVKGAFEKVSGSGFWDGRDLATAWVDVTIDAASINTREPQRDAHLRSADFLDVEKFPTLTFKSAKIGPAGPGLATMAGDLTIHGVTKSVTLHVTGPTPIITDPYGFRRVGASATTTINRKDFGLLWNQTLDAGGVVVGDEVTITIEVEMVKKAGA